MHPNGKCNHFKISDMNRDNFMNLVSDEPSGWLKDAKRRKRWRWLNRLTLRPRIKYYVLKRAFLLWLHGVIGRFYESPYVILMIVYLIILIVMFLILLHPFIEYFTGYEMFPKFYD